MKRNVANESQKLGNLLEDLMEKNKVLTGVLSQDDTQFKSIWALRELLPESCGKAGAVYKYDLSVPVGEMYEIVEKMRERLRERGLLKGDGAAGDPIRAVVGYGHMGDGKCREHLSPLIAGNLHLNIVADKYTDEIEQAIEPYVYEIVCECFVEESRAQLT